MQFFKNCNQILVRQAWLVSFVEPHHDKIINQYKSVILSLSKDFRTVIILTALVILLNCKEAENPYIPTPDIFIRNFTENVPKKTEIELELREILNTENKFCETSFQNKKVELYGDNDNIFVSDREQFTAFTYLSVYKQKIKNKSDIFVLKSRCCPMGPCYTSHFFQKQDSGNWKLFDTIPGEVVDYKKTKDHTIIKIEDNILTTLTYVGFWKENQFEPLLVYRHMNIEIPNAFSPSKRIFTESKQLNLLKRPKEYHIDNLAFRLNVAANTPYFILNESPNHYFIFIKATSEQMNDVLENFKGDRQDIVEQIQGVGRHLKNAKDLEKLLNKTFYNVGWIEKF
ncbi:MAG: hypothetical protein IPO06_15670 [Leptospiraceae bacterium]|nr:hypothetical protein [Leptospiraceae bacterium]